MKRRHNLTFAAIITACLALVGCGQEAASKAEGAATAQQETFNWKMVTAWPKNYPGLGTSADRKSVV